jgi:hypothetical protein
LDKAAICSVGKEVITYTSCTFSYPCKGGIVLNNGEVLCVPSMSNTGYIEIYNPDTDSIRTVFGVPPDTQYWGAIGLPHNKYLVCPAVGQQGLIYNLQLDTLTLTDLLDCHPTSASINGGVSTTEGSAFVSTHDGTTSFLVSESSTVSPITYNNTSNLYSGCVLLPDGSILTVPYHADMLIAINFAAGTIQQVNLGKILSGYSGGLLLKDGSVVFLPYSATSVVTLQLSGWWANLPSLRFLTCPFINKL